MTFVHAKPGDDVMAGYDMAHHQSPDRNYVPGFGAKKSQPSSNSNSPKRDSLSNYWHIYAKNHSAQPYTEREKAFNANIFNHVKEHYGVEVAKAMHGHAEALRQGGIYSIRKKYNIMENNKPRLKKLITTVEIDPEQEAYERGRAKELEKDREEYKRDAENDKNERSKKNMNEDLGNEDKPMTAKELARKYIARFKEQKVRNRKRMRKVSDVYEKEKLQESILNSNGEQKFNELKNHPFVKNTFSQWHNPTSYGENHHSFQTKLHTFPYNGSTHDMRATVNPNGEHAVTFTSNHKNGLDSISGSGKGNNFHDAITNARANHLKAFNSLKTIHPKLAKGLSGLNNQFD